MTTRIGPVLLLLLGLLAAPALSAQEAPGWNEEPYAQTLTLRSGFSGDPRVVDVTPGGASANPLNGPGCVGYIGYRPDVVVNYSAGSFDLTFSASSETDINLVVRAPDGRYYCDDDSGDGLDPMLTVSNPRSGRYAVWVGVYGESGEYVDGVFGISELGNAVSMGDQGGSGQGFTDSGSTRTPTPAPIRSSSSTEIPGWDETPYAGSMTLEHGFSGDPRAMDVTPGGAQDNPLSGPGCVGYIGYRPDAVVRYNPSSFDLTFSAASETDINLVVRDPNGRYHCDDDSGEGLNPMLTIDNPSRGQYTVWVGVYAESSQYVDGVLGVSEVGNVVSVSDRGRAGQGYSGSDTARPTPLRVSSTEIPGWDETPYAGSMTLEHGFSGDPRTMNVTPGGAQDNPLSGPGCVGYIGYRPDAVVRYNPSSFDLTFSAASETDINLVVRDPNGRYHCDDDSGEGLNPALTVVNPSRGRYTVWVGVYGESSQYVDGVLGISELSHEVSVSDRN